MNTHAGIVCAAFLGAATLVGCESTPSYTSNARAIDDSTITANVKAALVQDPATRSRNISVNTLNGVVELQGFVDNRAERREAAHVAGSIAGVRTVRDQLQINDQDQTVGTAYDDPTISARVMAALMANPATDAPHIVVSTSHGVVQLAGFVDTNAERDAAANVAGSVQGVRAVDNDLRLNQ